MTSHPLRRSITVGTCAERNSCGRIEEPVQTDSLWPIQGKLGPITITSLSLSLGEANTTVKQLTVGPLGGCYGLLSEHLEVVKVCGTLPHSHAVHSSCSKLHMIVSRQLQYYNDYLKQLGSQCCQQSARNLPVLRFLLLDQILATQVLSVTWKNLGECAAHLYFYQILPTISPKTDELYMYILLP